MQATVDRNPVMVNEYFALTVVANDDIANSALNTSALAKDFIIGRTSVSRSTRIINFDASKETRWQILLAAKKLGNVTIPALTIAGVSSAPIPLSVVADVAASNRSQDVMLKATLSNAEPYVGELLIYKVKLYLAKDLQRGMINAPEVKDAQVKQLGEDVDGSEIIDGLRYRVIERVYGITLDKPGKTEIIGAKFDGDIINQDQSTNLFSFNQSRPVQANANNDIIEVLPIPVDYQGKWWVADLAMLTEKWDETQSFEVGVPITRTFTLVATNVEDYNLPSLNITAPQGVKVYPEKPQRQSILREGQLISQLTQTVAMVPTQAGPLTLPSISIPWWNPKLKQTEFVKLPARHIEVAPSSAMPQPPTGSLETTPAPTHTNTSHGAWPWLTLMFAILWLATLLAWWRASHRKPTSVIEPSHVMPTPGYQDLAEACHQQAIGHILSLTPNVCASKLGTSLSLANLAEYAPAVATTLTLLQQQAYSQTNTQDTKALCQQLLAQVQALKPLSSQHLALVKLNP
nr:BatD family protein [Shewanella sp. NIFS-20-20]